jgi:hypothetical protein
MPTPQERDQMIRNEDAGLVFRKQIMKVINDLRRMK